MDGGDPVGNGSQSMITDTEMEEAKLQPEQGMMGGGGGLTQAPGTDNIPATLSHGGRFIQYNIFGNIFEVTSKYRPPIMPIGKGAYGIVWFVICFLICLFRSDFRSFGMSDLDRFCLGFVYSITCQFFSELRDWRAGCYQENCQCFRQ